jgi:hypothetical protein
VAALAQAAEQVVAALAELVVAALAEQVAAAPVAVVPAGAAPVAAAVDRSTAKDEDSMSNGSSGPPPGSLEEQAVQALIQVLKTSSSPEAAQAQAIMLRRLALEGDVVGSRIPTARNITEVAGYFNLLTTLGQPEMRAQMLAGALGVAGPNPPLGWLPTQPKIGFVSIPNDRPSGPWQGTIPVSFQVSSSFAPALQLALQGLHDRGCALPIVAPVRALPPTPAAVPADLLPLLGRAFDVVPGTALRDPDTDLLAIARLGAGPWQLVARAISAGPIGVNPAPWEAQACTAAGCSVSPSPAGRRYVPVAPVLATAGFTPAVPGHQPTSVADMVWARFINVSGLVPGVTTLGDELTLLYSQSDIAASGLIGRTGDRWNGAVFAGG